MGLFQTSVLKKYIKLQDEKAVGKAFKKYTKYFHNPERQENIFDIKEEGFQQKFLMELFVNIFDYIINPDPNYNLTTEYKNEKGAKKADGAILKNEKALAVIELKSTNTKDLEKIRQQAFDYKANHSECVYVITSNFEKLRFYINNAVDFEEFNLFTLNENEFELLYLCLHKENILNNLPLKIKNDSIVAEESITKTFYSDYSLFKRELFRDLVKENMNNEVFRAELQKEDKDRATKNIKQTIFKKSQKLIDRFLFIFFAEDKGLLPPNSTLQILNKWKADWDFGDERPLYDLFKQYFHFLDTGRKGTQSRAEIFAYNGGLFKPDPILDSFILDDQLLFKHTKTLSDYDFESQVGVNILGHIFENSLNEIESINAEIEGTDFDKQKTKRKKDGVFYTPKYITKYIVDNTIGKLCDEKKQKLEIQEEEYQKSRKGRKTDTLKKLKAKLDTYRNWLLTLTILDPACGSGAFLNQALDFLIKEHTYIDELETSLLGGSMLMRNIENTILENNIYGVDINEESVEIAKLSLWLRTAQPRRKLNTLNNNIKCGNSLIDDQKVAGDKAFNWQNEFPHIFENGGFDVVIGNPPYGASFNNDEKLYFKKIYSKIHKRTPESFNYFLFRIENIINSSSKWGVIIPSSFLYQHEFEKNRKYILNNSTVNKILNLGDDIFQDVATPTCIIIVSKNGGKSEYIDLQIMPRNLLPTEIFDENKLVDASNLIKNESFSYIVKPNRKLIQKCYNQPKLKEIAEDVATGISPGLGKAFVKTKLEVEASKLEDELLKNLIIGGEINRYFLNPISTKKIIYATNETQIENYPNTYSELNLYKNKLDKRVETASGRIKWYVMLRPRRLKLFEKEKILIRQTANKIIASYDSDKWYCLKSGLIVQLPSDSNITYEYLLGVLNSKLMDFIYQDLVGEGGRIFPEVKPVQLFKLPIKIPNLNNEILQSKSIESNVQKIQKDWSELIDKQRQFLEYLQAKYNIKKPSKSLQNWLKIDNKSLLSELKKSEISLDIKTEIELLKFFTDEKKEVKKYTERIEKTDKEIDQMVYKLYGLSKDEINIVEEAV